MRRFFNTRLLALMPLVVLTALPLPSRAQSETAGRRTASLSVSFRQGHRTIDPDYMGNASRIASFSEEMRRYVADYTIAVESVDIVGGASIEGSAELNADLSNNRAQRMVEILRRFAVVPQEIVHVDSRGVNWEDVSSMVLEDASVPSRDEVLSLLSGEPESERKPRLEALDGGVPYAYMYEHIFPYVRTGKMTVTFRTLPKVPVAPAPARVRDTVVVVNRDTVYHVFPNGVGNLNAGFQAGDIYQAFNGYMPAPGRRGRRGYMVAAGYPYGFPLDGADGGEGYRPTRMERMDSLLREPVLAFRSNLLVPAMNVGVELPLGNRWSLSADWYYPWVWRHPDHKDCFEFLGGTAEVRYWFGRRHRPGQENAKYRFLGHSVALVAGAGYYDFERDWAGFQGEYGALGLDYTYAMPIGRKAGMHLEFDVTAGGIVAPHNIPYDVFTEGGILLHRDGLVNRWSWVGPIKCGVSLVVPVFRKTRVSLVEDAGKEEREL